MRNCAPKRLTAKQPRRRKARRFELLEARLYLHGDALDWHQPDVHADEPDFFDLDPSGLEGPSEAQSAGPAFSLADLPVLNSLVGAAVSLYLNFLGDFTASWGSYSNITTPVFDIDGDATSFSAGELTTIQNIWTAVAEDFAPFKINVTTVRPPSFANGVAMMIDVGGAGAWTGGTYGGVAYINSFTNGLQNVAFVFSENLADNAKYIADAVSHEAGHTFGLDHQSYYDAQGNKTEYNPGPGNGTAPLMGNSYAATRSLWWYGTSASPNTFQDDMTVLARGANGFGYRADDHGNSAGSATALPGAGNSLSGSGIIATTGDVDYFSFVTGAGQVTFSATVGAFNNLDLKLELRDASGNLIGSASPANSFGATITTTLAAGSYRLVVASGGGYGNVGQYSLSGTIVPPSTAPTAPSNLTATITPAKQADLAWTDNSANESGFQIFRSLDGGKSWKLIATVGADATGYTDVTMKAGKINKYKVQAFNEGGTSAWSNTAKAIKPPPPAIPTGLAAIGVSPNQVDLSWSDNATNETAYRIQRSANNGKSWNTIADVGADVNSYSDTTVVGAKKYSYRVRALGSSGMSKFSNVAKVTTPSSAPALAGSLQRSAGADHSSPGVVTPGTTAAASVEEIPARPTPSLYDVARAASVRHLWAQHDAAFADMSWLDRLLA